MGNNDQICGINNGKEENKVKRTNESAREREIKYVDYKDCLKQKKTMLSNQFRFRSKSNEVTTKKLIKLL